MSSSALPRRLPPLPTLRDILRMYNVKARRSLSQNFLLDPMTLNRLARTAGDLRGKTVVEVGPGPGGITRALIGNGAREVHVVEKDDRFLPSLQLLQEASGNVLHINIGDCLNYNMTKLFRDELRRTWHDPVLPDVHLVGNLPFNVATPFLIRLLRSMQRKDNLFSYGRVPCLLTFQKEVASRMIAAPGDPERCRLSVMAQNLAEVRLRYVLSGGAFSPPPKVDVGVVSLTPLRTPYIDLPFPFVEKAVTAIFHGKRKPVRRTLKNLFPRTCNQEKLVNRVLDTAHVNPESTAIHLNMDEMEKLVYSYHQLCEEMPFVANYFERELRTMTLEYEEVQNVMLGEGNRRKREAQAISDGSG